MTKLVIILSVLTSFLANLEQKTLQSDFTVTVAEEVNAPMNYPGSLTMQGDKFLLTMYGIEAAYDGKTMYMYSGETDELTLTNPTQQELTEANPFLFAKALVNACNNVEKTSGENTIVTLTPKDKSAGIDRFVLKLRTADLLPLSVELKEGKKMTTLKLTNPRFVTLHPEFIIKSGKDTYINDLRL